MLCLSVVPEGVKLSKYRNNLACSSEALIKEQARKNNLPPDLLAAVIFVESGWDRKAFSGAGACGLTQVIPKWTGPPVTKRKYTCRELKRPKRSIVVGAKILGYWVHTYGKGNVRVGLCGYSSGYRCYKTTYYKGKKVATTKPRRRGPGMRYARKVLKYKKRIKKE